MTLAITRTWSHLAVLGYLTQSSAKKIDIGYSLPSTQFAFGLTNL